MWPPALTMTNSALDQQWKAFNPPVSLLQDVSSTIDWPATNPGLIWRNSAVTFRITLILMSFMQYSWMFTKIWWEMQYYQQVHLQDKFDHTVPWNVEALTASSSGSEISFGSWIDYLRYIVKIYPAANVRDKISTGCGERLLLSYAFGKCNLPVNNACDDKSSRATKVKEKCEKQH